MIGILVWRSSGSQGISPIDLRFCRGVRRGLLAISGKLPKLFCVGAAFLDYFALGDVGFHFVQDLGEALGLIFSSPLPTLIL
jgi:hypothetical protein